MQLFLNTSSHKKLFILKDKELIPVTALQTNAALSHGYLDKQVHRVASHGPQFSQRQSVRT